jgi:hypothetical protein
MNRLRKVAACLAIVLGLSATEGLSQKATPLVDFTVIPRDSRGKNDRTRWPFEYAYGDWGRDKARLVEGKGLLINHLGSRGGVGANRPLPLKGADKAVMVFIIGNTNEADAFSLALVDSDGSEHSFRIPLAGMQTGQVLTAVLQLTKSKQVDKPGAQPGLDLKKLKSWQVKGDFGDKPVEVMVQRILAYHDA